MNYPSNLLSDLKPIFRGKLEEIYDPEEAENLVNILIEHHLGMTRMSQVLKPDFRLSESELLNFHFDMKRLLKSEPIQYVLGVTEFYGMKFQVNTDVLIPRPETEELVHLIIHENFENKRILDIGTGSGCIAIALQKNLRNCHVAGLDVSKRALETARKNAHNNDAKVEFIESDIRETGQMEQLGEFDVIVSNPPYVTHQDKSLMNKNVLEWEPSDALFAPEEYPLYFYDKILEFTNKHLSEKGQIFLEINESYGQQLKKLIESYSFSQISIHQDFRGKDRFIRATK